MANKLKEDTSAEYDDCVGFRDESTAPGSLGEFFGVDVVPKDEKEAWKQLWVGMPTFNNKKVNPLRTLTINFATEEAFDEFVTKVGYKTVTRKTKTIWFPEIPREENSLMRFIDGDDNDE